MKNIEKWEEGKEQYELDDGFILIRANEADYGIHYAIYGDMDDELTYSWNKLSHDTDGDDFNRFWIFKDNKKVGGVVIQPNFLAYLFVVSPYSVDKFSVISELNNALLHWSDKNKKIVLYTIPPRDVDSYNRLGYRRNFARRMMIRPTEIFDDIKWREDLVIKIPTIEDAIEIGKVLHESYKGGIHYEEFSNNTQDEEVEYSKMFLERYISTNSIQASTLVYGRNTNELIGVCLAGKNEEDDNEFSMINQIGVTPGFRGDCIAKNMIKRALTVLKDISPAVKLDVTVGNAAEGLYYKMGFLPGVQSISMYKKFE
ncbi:GNAT family N-acetyltransferase [Vallitalea okinawensis]|uniref:GNAT family N-acetyltransferase n=1 Tax=Vallitalea okinawensis TaxID=2078660 RepID=UPI000CFCE65D|nr:GNAT family N-acetyltransferase [Vallitalea okinawensis]